MRKRGIVRLPGRQYEELLFQTGNIAEMVLGGLFSLSEKDGDLEKARMFTEKLIQLAELFETGEYHKATARMSLALARKGQKPAGTTDGKSDFRCGSAGLLSKF